MSGFSLNHIQQGMYDALIADAALMGMISGVYDRVADNTAYPYVVIGDATQRDWSTATTNGAEITGIVHVYSRTGGRKETLDIMERIYDVLDDGSLSLAGQSLIVMNALGSDIELLRDGRTYHGTLTLIMLAHD